MILPAPWQLPQTVSTVKKPWEWRVLPAPRQAGQVMGLEPFSAPDARTGLAGRQCRHADRRLFAGERLLEADFHVVAQIAAALAGLLAAPAAHELAEHLLEDVGKAAGGLETAALAAAPCSVLEGAMAEAVIGGALLIVLQDVIGFVDFLEFVLGRLVARIAIRMILHGQRTIGLLELIGVRLARDAERFIVILFCHRSL